MSLKHPNGTHTLLAHMSSVSVSVGQTVSACQIVGRIGLTGRTFGPHVHMEVYPAGVTPATSTAQSTWSRGSMPTA